MQKTRKLPVGYDPKRPNKKLGHMVPRFVVGLPGDGFVAVDSPKESSLGHIVYLGVDVTSADIWTKMEKSGLCSLPRSEVLARLDSFLEMLQQFKIGYIVSAAAPEGVLKLSLVSTFTPMSKPSPLP